MSNMFPNKVHRFFSIFFDLFLLLLGYAFAFLVLIKRIEYKNIDAFISVLPWILLIGLIFFSVYELDRLVHYNKWDLVRKLAIALSFTLLITMAFSFFFREFALPRSVTLLAHVFAFILLFTWKTLYTKYKIMKYDGGKAVYIGSLQEFEDVKSQLSNLVKSPDNIKWVNSELPTQEINSCISNSDYVLISTAINDEKKSKVIYFAIKNNKVVYIVPNVYDLLVLNSSITTLDDRMVVQIKPFGLSLGQLALKRLLDIFAAISLLILSAPILIFVSILIKLEDNGSVFYKQERVGRSNKRFYIYKIRSMVEGAENTTGPTLAKKNDKRITKVGSFIRKTRIDELPQLYNVLKGDMSLVGPRPERSVFIKQFQKENDWFIYRNSVKPGITGYAQVMGKYTTNVDDKLRFDLFYIRNYSIWLDIVILLQTILVVVNKDKSEGLTKKTVPEKYLLKKKEKIT